ncbi:hypothetical protein [Pontiella agarivorans]|uniref:Cep192/Spd-2-like domain-containing protein n=1 Tax=Pontiella agarivorans TaxID=3038953 RepID=A0ABU5MWG1_9BACT|nr:hypothetical protein [Pontiella agarivorans]MDZ8118529.1 hypothetical protein [Pontiella agarivorans]
MRVFLFMSICSCMLSFSQPLLVDQGELIFSGVAGKRSEPRGFTLWNQSDEALEGLTLKLTGRNADCFQTLEKSPVSLKPNGCITADLVFVPPKGRLGVLKAECQVVNSAGEIKTSVALAGLSAIGVEGDREPTLQRIVETLGLQLDVGWNSLHSDTGPTLQGDEIRQQRFRKASAGDVKLEPVARYSPNFLLPTAALEAPELHPIGTLGLKTRTRAEHNALFPSLASGTTCFDPGNAVFGIFTSSPSHVAYTEDVWNSRLEPKHVKHAVRIFPVQRRAGKPVKNVFLICFEEAKNGDYQDYVFLLCNVVPEE